MDIHNSERYAIDWPLRQYNTEIGLQLVIECKSQPGLGKSVLPFMEEEEEIFWIYIIQNGTQLTGWVMFFVVE